MGTVFVLMESGRPLPVAVFADRETVHEALPQDAVLVRKSDTAPGGAVEEWRSERQGTTFTLACHRVI